MPFDMINVQAIVIGDNVYVGGGYTRSQNKGVVMVYSLNTESWRKLLPQESKFFGMTAVNNQLVLVGGLVISTDKETRNVLSVWDELSQRWTHPFPEMRTSRHTPSVVSYQKWLVVAGGGRGGSYLNRIEILDTLSGQWYEGPPLPSVCSGMSSAVNGNMWYLAGGFTSPTQANTQVFSACLDELISQAVSQSAGTTSPSTPSPWQTLTDTPLIFSTVSVLNGALLAVGGGFTSAIHHYQPSRRSWVKVGDLPTQRWQCACTVLPNREIFVAGGGGENSQRLDIGAVTF